MLTNAELATVAAAAAWLAGCADKAARAHGKALADLVARGTSERRTLSEKAQARKGTGTGGRPLASYLVELDPEWRTVVQGMRAVQELVAETLTEKPGNGQPPSAGSLAVTISRQGQWTRLLETDIGVQVLTVTRAKTDNPS